MCAMIWRTFCCTRNAIPGSCDFERSVDVFATTWRCFTVLLGSWIRRRNWCSFKIRINVLTRNQSAWYGSCQHSNCRWWENITQVTQNSSQHVTTVITTWKSYIWSAEEDMETDNCSYKHKLSSCKIKAWKKSGPKGIRTYNLCDTGAVH